MAGMLPHVRETDAAKSRFLVIPTGETSFVLGKLALFTASQFGKGTALGTAGLLIAIAPSPYFFFSECQ